MASASETFTEIAGSLDYPMLVVTTAAAGERAGCLVGFWTQASIDPARFLVCLSENNRTFRLARRADALAVHVLPAEAEGLARLFGGDTGDEVDKFSRCRWHMGPRGMPILDDCPRWFVGDVIERHALGDHTGFVLAPCAAFAAGGSWSQLAFSRIKSLEPGHEA
jgi:flavin reductase (DIM6/NTAB) family NADH-FMN oxidoreductase RutF